MNGIIRSVFATLKPDSRAKAVAWISAALLVVTQAENVLHAVGVVLRAILSAATG